MGSRKKSSVLTDRLSSRFPNPQPPGLNHSITSFSASTLYVKRLPMQQMYTECLLCTKLHGCTPLLFPWPTRNVAIVQKLWFEPSVFTKKSTRTTTENSCLGKSDSSGDPVGTSTLGWASTSPTYCPSPYHLGFRLAVVTYAPEYKLQRCWDLLVNNKHMALVRVPSPSAESFRGSCLGPQPCSFYKSLWNKVFWTKITLSCLFLETYYHFASSGLFMWASVYLRWSHYFTFTLLQNAV